MNNILFHYFYFYSFFILKAGIYFNGQFTFMAWIKLKKNGYAYIIDFGNGYYNSIEISSDHLDHIIVQITKIGLKKSIKSWSALTYEWSHLAVVQENNGETSLFFDGVLSGMGTLQTLTGINQTKNYIGRSSYQSYSRACLDEMKIFNVALDELDIRKQAFPETKLQPKNSKINFFFYYFIFKLNRIYFELKKELPYFIGHLQIILTKLTNKVLLLKSIKLILIQIVLKMINQLYA